MNLKSVEITDDLVAIKDFKWEWIIKSWTNIEIWNILNIWWVNFVVEEISYRIIGTLNVYTKENWLYELEIPTGNNYEAYEYYEKTTNN